MADPLFITGCGHEPKDGFDYPVISHAQAQDCGNRLALRVLDKGGKTRLVVVSCERLLALLAGPVDG